MNLFKLSRKNQLILSAVIVTIFVIAIFIFYKAPQTPIIQVPVSSPNNEGGDIENINIKGLKPDSLEIGKSTLNDVQNTFGKPLSTDKDTYEFSSNSPVENNIAIFKENKLYFFKEILTYKQERKLDDFLSRYGLDNPLLLFGEGISDNVYLFAYPDKGIAYKANPQDEYLVEIWYFSKTDEKTFRETFAKDYYDTPEEYQENAPEGF